MQELRVVILVVVSTLAVIAAGCKSVPRTGRVYITDLPPIDWHRYGAEFQPSFKLSESEALAGAVPTTGQVERSVVDSFSLGLKIRASGGAVDGAERGSTSDATSLPGPGELPEASAAREVLDASGLAIDPRLQYILATALWQEVRLLNRYVRNAVVGTSDDVEYAPYLVRLQVTNRPVSETASYVAEIDLDFAASGDDVAAGKPVVLVPMLVNDHIEAILASRRDEEMRRFAMSLAALFRGVGFGIDLDTFRREINRSLSREFGSLLSVTPYGMDSSSLNIRLGARRTGDETYVATSEPRFVSIIVLVPFQPRPATKTKGEQLFMADATAATQAIGPREFDGVRVTASGTAVFRDPTTGRETSRQGGVAFGFDVTRPRVPWLGENQTALAYDDGDRTIVVLRDAEGFSPDDVKATWFFRDAGDANAAMHAVSAGNVSYAGGAYELTFEFPSFAKLGLAPIADGLPADIRKLALNRSPRLDAASHGARDASDTRTFVVELRNRARGEFDETTDAPDERNVRLFYPWIYKAKDGLGAARSGFKVAFPQLDATDPKLPLANGPVTLAVSVTVPKDDTGKFAKGFRLAVDGAGATLTKATPATAATPSGRISKSFDLVESGDLEFTLDTLYEGRDVEIRVTPPSGYAAPGPVRISVFRPTP